MPLSTGTPGVKNNLANGSRDRGTRALVILLAISLVLVGLHVREGGTGPVSALRGAFQFLTTPIRYVGAAVTAPVRGIGNVVANLTADQATLTELIEENELLRARNAELTEEAKMTERLEDLLELRSTYSLQSTAARIISQSADSWSSTVTIDKGSSAGIAVGMPVTDSKGAIGQVVETSVTSSVVRLLSDENSGVSALVQSSRAQGVLRGSADARLSLELVRTDQVVVAGDMIVTSGLGGVFPKGLPLGKVASVEKAPGALYYDIIVEPLSAVETYEEVLVVTSITEDQRATTEDIEAADAQDSEVDALVFREQAEASSAAEEAGQEGTASDEEADY